MDEILELNEDGKVFLGVLDINATKLVIPEGVEGIEEDAFFGCSSLKRQRKLSI